MPLPSWKKVLVVDLGFLGDTIHSIPAIRALAISGTQVDVMTTPVGGELLALIPEVNRAWIVPLRKPSPPPWQQIGMLRSIRSEQYDAAITFVGSDRNLFSTAWSGARQRIGHLTGRNSWPARWRLTQTISARDRSEPVYEQRLSILRELGRSDKNPGWAWKIPEAEALWVREQTRAPFLHLSISAASTPLNEWPLDAWSETLQQVWKIAPRLHVVATGVGSEREMARLADLLSLVKDERLQIFMNRLPVSRLAALLQSAQLHVGLDSGVLHLAMALGKPTLSLFRESVGRAGWAPRGKQHQVLIRPCPCNVQGSQKCSGSRALCLSQISPQEVARAILEIASTSAE